MQLAPQRGWAGAGLSLLQCMCHLPALAQDSKLWLKGLRLGMGYDGIIPKGWTSEIPCPPTLCQGATAVRTPAWTDRGPRGQLQDYSTNYSADKVTACYSCFYVSRKLELQGIFRALFVDNFFWDTKRRASREDWLQQIEKKQRSSTSKSFPFQSRMFLWTISLARIGQCACPKMQHTDLGS